MTGRITPPPALAALLAAHRAAAAGDGRTGTLPARRTLDTGLPPGSYRVNEDGTLTPEETTP